MKGSLTRGHKIGNFKRPFFGYHYDILDLSREEHLKKYVSFTHFTPIKSPGGWGTPFYNSMPPFPTYGSRMVPFKKNILNYLAAAT